MLPEIGDRIELIQMGPDPSPIPRGATGTVTNVVDTSFLRRGTWQIWVDWDSDRTLNLCYPEDRFKVLKEGVS